eukprot:6036485-Prorocentrum_lima.AAC.1
MVARRLRKLRLAVDHQTFFRKRPRPIECGNAEGRQNTPKDSELAQKAHLETQHCVALRRDLAGRLLPSD